MQQQQRVLNQPTQADLQDEYGFGDLQIHPADQENEEDGAADGGDMFRAEAGGWGGLAAVPHSPGAQSGSGGSKGGRKQLPGLAHVWAPAAVFCETIHLLVSFAFLTLSCCAEVPPTYP
jgi:hypothetical protein